MQRRLVEKILAIAVYRLPTNNVFEQTPFPYPICFICLMLGDQGLHKVDLQVGGVAVVDCVRRQVGEARWVADGEKAGIKKGPLP